MNPLSSLARLTAAGALIALACASATAMALSPTYSTPDARQLGDKVFGTKSVTCADNGAGTHSACTLLFQGVGNVSYTCSDTDGCDVTMSELGVYDGAIVRITNVSANTVYFPNSSGVLQTAGAATASVVQWATYAMKYTTDRWVEVTRSGVPGTTITLANGESVSNAVDGTITLGRDTAGTVTVTAADDNAVAALTILPGGAAPFVLGGATTQGLTIKDDGTGVTFNRATTGSVTLTATDDDANATLIVKPGGTGALTLGSTTATGTTIKDDGTGLTVNRATTGTVTIQATDDDANATLAMRGGGTGAVIIGNASNTSVTITTDGTGNGELVVPNGSIGVAELTRPGHWRFQICGDAVTVNANTIYYGPSQVISSSATVGGRTCDTTAAGNATEATAQTKPLTGQAFGVTSMVCTSDNPGVASGLTFTLRDNSGATTPSVTCNVANGAAGSCVANTQTTVDFASADPVAVAVSSSQDVGTAHFICQIEVVF